MGYGFWAVEEKGTGRFLGEVGFADFKRNIAPTLDGMPEIGWVLAPYAHGRGIATEAVGAALAWADGHLDADHTACLIAPANEASRRVAEKQDYEMFANTVFRDSPTLILRRPRLAG